LCILEGVSNGGVVGQLEGTLEDLARKWERFFAHDRHVPTPPEKEREALERRLREVSREEKRSAADQFRLEQLLHRFTTYNQLWQRLLREREEARKAASAMARAANETGAAPVPDAGDEYRKVFSTYAAALSKTGKKASVDYARFRETLEQQRRQLEGRGSVVEGFEVVEEGTQVRVRARVRRGRQE
jgi:predicted ribosome quality control (RQC) complex YloA/Tae2 family protein